jgi:hypothetical protein
VRIFFETGRLADDVQWQSDFRVLKRMEDDA